MDKDLSAFPVPPSIVKGVDESHAEPGMSLRDYFAAQAMQGLLANGWCAEERDLNLQAGYLEVAMDAYMMADAMIKARSKRG
jgi:hypothetical protein